MDNELKLLARKEKAIKDKIERIRKQAIEEFADVMKNTFCYMVVEDLIDITKYKFCDECYSCGQVDNAKKQMLEKEE